ncbi:hypothetical protein E1B28_003105 [Marasmius oreades]|uniref:Uncharacterized protein n=1 Tax=Marasmius oreades TaxID=181124 RepID=A0A9P7UK37_9AGAR|nr:uncharacterized protein E1B28_003105 [Marasmius oreades]KAG7085548.1 hypothetical protein E1B28_003105 [Marasmius oreades]
MDTRTQSWTFTVIRSKGLHLLRPERSWRPVVSITVEDKNPARSRTTAAQRNTSEYETVLGLDGQNPNQKEVFVIGPHASNTTKLSIQVFYNPPGKKKAKRMKRIPVACCSCSLGEVVAKQDAQGKKHAPLKLQPLSSSKRSKKKNDADCGQAVLYIRVCPPSFHGEVREDISSEDEYGYTSHHPETTDYTSSEPPSSPTDPVPIHIPIPIPAITTGIDVHTQERKQLKKRKKIRGFRMNSDDDRDETSSGTCSEYEPEDAGYDSTLDKAVNWDEDEDEDGETTLISPEPNQDEDKWGGGWSWISAMLDPIIPMHHSHSSSSRGSEPTIICRPDEDELSPRSSSPPNQIKFQLTASPEPHFAELKPFTPDNDRDLDKNAHEHQRRGYLWTKLERLLCAFTVYGELCAAARALDSLVQWSKLHHRSESLGPSLRSNSFSSFRSWGSGGGTLVEGDVEGGLFRGGGGGGGRYGANLTVNDHHDGGFDDLERQAREKVEKVYSKLQMEWSYVGGLLAALAAVNTAVFAISPDSLFGMNSYARPLVATSSVFSGCGIVCVVWFLCWYGWGSGVGLGGNATVAVSGGLGGVDGFMARALDINSTYVSFAIASRIPAGCMLCSALTLMGFLGLVAYDTAPVMVVIVCSGVAVGMGGQFVVWGIIRAVKGVAWGVRGVGRGVRCGCGKVVGVFRPGVGGENSTYPGTTASPSPVVVVPPPPPVLDTGRG